MRRLNSGLRRAGTLQAPPLKGHPQQAYSDAQSPSPTGADEDDYDNESQGLRSEEDYFRMPAQQGQGQYPTSPMSRTSPWGTPGAPNNDWRTSLAGNVNPNIGPGPSGVDDVSRALSALELNQQYAAGNGYQQGQSAYAPRFNPPHHFDLQPPGMRNNGSSGMSASRKLQLVTDLDNQLQQSSIQSASAYVPPIGHAMQQQQQQGRQSDRDEQHHYRDRALTASGSNPWDAKERLLSGRMSNPNLHNLYQNKNGIPSVPPLPAQYLNNQGQAPRMGLANSQGTQSSHDRRGSTHSSSQHSPPFDNNSSNNITSPIDVPSLIATKGYNPAEFDVRPLFVS